MKIFVLAAFGMSLALGVFSSFRPTEKSAGQKPNIILIVADDLGYGDVGFNGQTKIKTPNLDRLAAEGMNFRQQYAGTSVCGPSRAALLTGIHTAHATVRELSEWSLNGKPADLIPADVTVAEELRRAGYKTGIIGKWGLDEGGTTGNALAQGFDSFYGFRTHREAHHYYPEYIWQNNEKVLLPENDCAKKIGTYSNDSFASQALTFIQEHTKEPFFLYLPFTLPHNELTVPDDSKRAYLNLGWPKRPMQVAHYHHDLDGNLAYAGMVSRLDRYVGQLMAELKKQDLDENTLVIFTSDNGPGFDNGFFDSNGPFRGGKLQLYEGGIRVPFVARWPGKIKAGSVSGHPCAFWDFLPTACEVAGIKPTANIDGISYLPELLGKSKKQKKHDYLYWEINEREGPVQAVVMGPWKGIRFYEKPFELYNLHDDTAETTNLADKHPNLVAKIKTLMNETRTENPEFPLTKRKALY
ncbi:arylsulfatase [Larkinella knui]|uniref:Arylsulfatase n=1 Tax=Larkinella knui TaxID=2025310 RepID=A0A3P1CMD4_9BACT|nr:arylsulfatase [Larkinella knui]